MKKIVVSNYKEFGDMPEKKTLVIIGDEKMDAQDGYHTFDELYDHRITLYIALCKMYMKATGFKPWRSKLHNDGTAYEGWYILGIMDEPRKQISYHIPIERWDETNFADTRALAPVWDNHTSGDVLERLKQL